MIYISRYEEEETPILSKCSFIDTSEHREQRDNEDAKVSL